MYYYTYPIQKLVLHLFYHHLANIHTLSHIVRQLTKMYSDLLLNVLIFGFLYLSHLNLHDMLKLVSLNTNRNSVLWTHRTEICPMFSSSALFFHLSKVNMVLNQYYWSININAITSTKHWKITMEFFPLSVCKQANLQCKFYTMGIYLEGSLIQQVDCE